MTSATDDALITDPLDVPQKSILTKELDDKLIDDPLSRIDRQKYDDPLINGPAEPYDALSAPKGKAAAPQGIKAVYSEAIKERDVEAFKASLADYDEEKRIRILGKLQKDYTRNPHGMVEHTNMTQAVIETLKDDASTVGFQMNSGKLMTLSDDAMKLLLDAAGTHADPVKILAHHIELSSQNPQDPTAIGVLLTRFPSVTIDQGLEKLAEIREERKEKHPDYRVPVMMPGFMADVRALEKKINENRTPAAVTDVVPDVAPVMSVAPEATVAAPPAMNIAPQVSSVGPVLDAAPAKPAAPLVDVAPEPSGKPTFIEEALKRGGTSTLLPDAGRSR